MGETDRLVRKTPESVGDTYGDRLNLSGERFVKTLANGRIPPRPTAPTVETILFVVLMSK